MASTTSSPSPNSSPTTRPPPPPSTSGSSGPQPNSPTSSSSSPTQLNQTTNPTVSSTPSNSLAPPLLSPPPATPAASPPSTPAASPPSTPSSSPPPPPPPSSSRSTPPLSAPPPSPPPSSPPAPPPSPPPSPPTSPPPAPTLATSPPVVSPPPPVHISPPPPPLPPQASPTTPVTSPPPPRQAVSPSPPPPPDVPPPPLTNSPPSPPVSKPPKSSPSPPEVNSPPPSSPPVATGSPPPPVSTLPSPPPSVPSTPSILPPGTSPAPPQNSPASGSHSNETFPSIPTEKPTARATNGPDITANSTSTNSGGFSSVGAIAIGIVVGFVILSFLVMAVWIVHKRKRKRSKSNVGYVMPSPFGSSNSESLFLRAYPPVPLQGSPPGSDIVYSPSEAGGVNNSKSWFTYNELAQATNGFSTQNLLGEGGFGCVYKGILADGREVAVKQLKIGGSQGEREFRAEVEIISRVHHRHLVSLVGYCISENQRLLVYDYLPNNTLHYHLHGEGRPIMDWAVRVKVAAGAARGIAYLHEDCHPRIIHRDIKSSNILLDSNYEARVSDFGLAKLALELESNTHVTTRVMGTFGYMAPEYATSGKLTEKSDVYSFGVVLLELITGRKPVDASQPLGDESLVEWARPLLTEALDREDFEALVDPKLGRNYVAGEMFRMIEAAAACVRHSAAKRPRMSQVVRALDSLDLSDLSNGVRPGQSEIYDSREQSAQIRMFQRLAFGSQDYSSDFFDHTQSSWRSGDRGDRGSYMP
ncbi:hypothetical protein K2173_025946 [Erythroxylum novogranatense]|uniref:non-specific serine/threonine protein kinase n=1 Tax=Erythroxylum novogranatense TaxID=1862640 RepID=A0AAV8SHV2_9ROSI|nr:hypothetical protein K2173_025946 [Erythroxylum novogranatense]